MAAKPSLPAPFLRRIAVRDDRLMPAIYPFTVPLFANPEFELSFSKPITIIVGANGSGKSTLLEAIARHCGFSLGGGSRDHAAAAPKADGGGLADALRFSWLPKVMNGFFFRAESFFDFSGYIDQLATEFPIVLNSVGGAPLLTQSHGESFLALFRNRLGSSFRAFYVLDEPEAALSPSRQLEFLGLMHTWHNSGNVQAIIATHSPIVMAYPNAEVLGIDSNRIAPFDYRQSEQYQVMRDFLSDPEGAMRSVLDAE